MTLKRLLAYFNPPPPTTALKEMYDCGFLNGHAQGELLGYRSALAAMEEQLRDQGATEFGIEDLRAVRRKQVH